MRERCFVGDVSFDDFNARIETAAQAFRRARETANVVTTLAQARNEAAADIACGAGDQHAHALPALSAGCAPEGSDDLVVIQPP